MLFFGNIPEQPHIMVPHAILVMTARGVGSSLSRNNGYDRRPATRVRESSAELSGSAFVANARPPLNVLGISDPSSISYAINGRVRLVALQEETDAREKSFRAFRTRASSSC